MKRNRLFIIAAAVLGAALILFVVNTDSSPQSGDVVGTIGAAGDPIPGVEQADRYRSQQIDDAAVTLENPQIQELLQDDEVLRLVQDPAFQRALNHDVMRRGLMSEELQRAIVQAEFATGLSRIQSEQLESAALNREQRELFANRMFVNSDLARLVVENEALARVLVNNEALARAIARDEALGRALMANQDLQRLFANAEVLATMAELQRSGVFATEGFQRFLASDEAFSLMASVDMREAFFNRAALNTTQQ